MNGCWCNRGRVPVKVRACGGLECMCMYMRMSDEATMNMTLISHFKCSVLC